MAAVGLNNNGFLGEAGYQFQMADQEFFFKFPVGLIDQLNKVDIGQLNLLIPGTGLGGFDKILGQSLKPLGLLFQNL